MEPDGSDVDLLKNAYAIGAHISEMAQKQTEYACNRIHEVRPWGEESEIVGAVVGRQGSILQGFAGGGPMNWTAAVAPLFLRPMADITIRCRWMTEDESGKRIRQYMEHGYGEAKGYIEERKKLVERTQDPEQRKMQEGAILHDTVWIEHWRSLWSVDVIEGEPGRRRSIGDMARECGKEDLYHWAYATWSAAIHGSWYHVGRYNAAYCDHPLHSHSVRGTIGERAFDMDYLFRGCKYLDGVLEDGLRQERYKRSLQEELIEICEATTGQDPRFEKRWSAGTKGMITARTVEFGPEGEVRITAEHELGRPATETQAGEPGGTDSDSGTTRQ